MLIEIPIANLFPIPPRAALPPAAAGSNVAVFTVTDATLLDGKTLDDI